MITGTNADVDYDFRVTVSLNEGVGFWQEDGQGDATWLDLGGGNFANVDITQDGVTEEWAKPHIFRIELHAQATSPTVKLFLDNKATPALTFLASDLANNNLDNDVSVLAATSVAGKSKFELMHFRYRIGTTSFDEPPEDCAADFDDDDIVGASDLLELLEAWGPCTSCEEDIDDNGTVGASDLLILLASWGVCV